MGLKGIWLLQGALHTDGGPLFAALTGWTGGGESAASLLMTLGVLLGLVKGRLALRRSALRIARRIAALPERAPLYHLYSWHHYLFVASMIALGISLKAMGVPPEIRGPLLIGVAVSLTIGALTLLKCATCGRENPS